ncbi:hypothetical protein F4780DRAFT_774245 [Xylariomycetidae sp. FL0641]|nr:hypothetical protein F4780DRAFT_774245 [Xylariomycetidae sp. FL0641]
MESMCIDERNTTDTLSRLLTIWQVFWFSVAELQRVRQGLPTTTLEVTALSFVFVMIWYRTPVDFAGGARSGIEAHWGYYVRLTQAARLPLVSRPITARPWDRFPSDAWQPPSLAFVPAGAAVLLFFSVSFLLAWDFRFPTAREQLLWRVAAAYHAVFVIYGGAYYLLEAVRWRNRRRRLQKERREAGLGVPRTQVSEDVRTEASVSEQQQQQQPPPHPMSRDGSTTQLFQVSGEVEAQELEPRPLRKGATEVAVRWLGRSQTWVRSWRNISLDQDPEMAVPLKVIVPVTVTCVVYVFARLFLYIEDFVALRSQPAGIYVTVNQFLPFLGDG